MPADNQNIWNRDKKNLTYKSLKRQRTCESDSIDEPVQYILTVFEVHSHDAFNTYDTVHPRLSEHLGSNETMLFHLTQGVQITEDVRYHTY